VTLREGVAMVWIANGRRESVSEVRWRRVL